MPIKSIFTSSMEAVIEAFKTGKKIDINSIIKNALKKTIIKEVQAGNIQLPAGNSEKQKK